MCNKEQRRVFVNIFLVCCNRFRYLKLKATQSRGGISYVVLQKRYILTIELEKPTPIWKKRINDS